MGAICFSLNACASHPFVQPEEKSKFDGIFESLVPVNGLLSGEKVKPVLINSKLPLDVLGKVQQDLLSFAIILFCFLYPLSSSCNSINIFIKAK